jgi:cytochrome c biogenesis protein CcdA
LSEGRVDGANRPADPIATRCSYFPSQQQEPRLTVPDLALVASFAAVAIGSGLGILITGLLLGFRHGFDWDHLAAITDITSTSAAADAGTELHVAVPHGHDHAHGGRAEMVVHEGGGGAAVATMSSLGAVQVGRTRLVKEQRHAIVLGTLYALGHALVVFALGMLALAFGAILPDWVDPIMARIVGFTLLFLGVWVFISLWQYLRNGTEFRLRSRWMLLFDGVRYAWRRFQARIHGHEHVAPLEMSSYGYRTAFGVGMIHGIGAETGSQALLIAAVGGATGVGLGVPMLLAFIVGLLASNTLVVVVSATGFVAGQVRRPLYIAIGVLAGVFSIAVGLAFITGTEAILPDLTRLLGGSL